MIRPVHFGFNAQTAVNNAFQVAVVDGYAQERARVEFDNFVQLLLDNGVDVTVIDDQPDPHTPDSIFPNNWVSFHQNGTVCLYPMYAQNRRLERRPGVLQAISEKFAMRKTLDLSAYEEMGLFLEGTGSMVLDRKKHIAYACLSPRTDKKVLQDFCEHMGYLSETFTAVDKNGQAIYHTNVMMCVADKYIVICLESLPEEKESAHLVSVMRDSGKEVLAITLEQMNQFAGNMLQVRNDKDEKLLVMSSRAYSSLNPTQIEKLQSFNRIIHAPLDTIETHGGGSARCMMAEVHLPVRGDA
jgi:hypothetical protein